MLGAMVGGGITYWIAKNKERKETKQKQLESLFELQKINFNLVQSIRDLQNMIKNYLSDSVKIEEISIKEVNKKVKECLDELANSRAELLGNAVHLSEDIFNYVSDKHDEIMKKFLFTTFSGLDTEYEGSYIKEDIENLENVINKMIILQDFLMQKEKLYVKHYLNEYTDI
ncbi:hypothetical protein [Bacillus luti]|nr:hypothetical protein [Bacillus luti]